MIGKPISRKEALRISSEIADKARKERRLAIENDPDSRIPNAETVEALEAADRGEGKIVLDYRCLIGKFNILLSEKETNIN